MYRDPYNHLCTKRDVRQASKPVTSYVEAHSDDITSLSFHPAVPFVLLSASSDSLVAVSDIRKTDEDDSVLGVINTGASVARAGWGGASAIRPKAVLEGEEDTPSDVPALGAFWSISDMQTVGIWEADGFEEVLSSQDVRRGEILLTPEWRTEFVIDASAGSQLFNSKDSVGLFCGNQDGSAALIELPNENGRDWTMHCRLTGAHSEIVRSVLWDLDNSCLFTGAEDGQICGWQLGAQGAPSQDAALSASTLQQERSTGAVKDERARTSYRPY
jgi:WD40 repeat protein